MYLEAEQIKQIVDGAHKIVIIQADNPDADSLGSALALEHILGDLGKEPYLYCGVDIPDYLRFLPGWDRVQRDLPNQFDASIIVDASTLTLLQKLSDSGQQGWLAAKPCIVLDHHEIVDNPVTFAKISLVDHTRASTGELIYVLAQQLNWQLSTDAQEMIMASILGDTQGLTNQLATAETYRLMAEMIDAGVSRPKLEEARRELIKMAPEILHYKGVLLQRTDLAFDDQIALVSIPQDEINTYSPLYNPGPLVQGDLLQTQGVQVAIVFKTYDDGRITASVRCNPNHGIAATLAEHFGGGGHAFAAGFKITDGRKFDEVKAECLRYAGELLENTR